MRTDKEANVRIDAYLNFNGNCKEAFEFYAATFRGTIDVMMPHAGTPAEAHVPAEWREKIMHVHLTVGDQVLMGSDVPPAMGAAKPNGFAVSVQVEEPVEADRIFKAFAEGGTVLMPLQPTFWSAKFGMCTDRFGTPWMINCTQQPAS